MPNPHETPDGSALRRRFVGFQKDSTEDYIRALRDHLHTRTAARQAPNITLSANNVSALWTYSSLPRALTVRAAGRLLGDSVLSV